MTRSARSDDPGQAGAGLDSAAWPANHRDSWNESYQQLDALFTGLTHQEVTHSQEEHP